MEIEEVSILIDGARAAHLGVIGDATHFTLKDDFLHEYKAENISITDILKKSLEFDDISKLYDGSILEELLSDTEFIDKAKEIYADIPQNKIKSLLKEEKEFVSKHPWTENVSPDDIKKAVAKIEDKIKDLETKTSSSKKYIIYGTLVGSVFLVLSNFEQYQKQIAGVYLIESVNSKSVSQKVTCLSKYPDLKDGNKGISSFSELKSIIENHQSIYANKPHYKPSVINDIKKKDAAFVKEFGSLYSNRQNDLFSKNYNICDTSNNKSGDCCLYETTKDAKNINTCLDYIQSGVNYVLPNSIMLKCVPKPSLGEYMSHLDDAFHDIILPVFSTPFKIITWLTSNFKVIIYILIGLIILFVFNYVRKIT